MMGIRLAVGNVATADISEEASEQSGDAEVSQVSPVSPHPFKLTQRVLGASVDNQSSGLIYSAWNLLSLRS